MRRNTTFVLGLGSLAALAACSAIIGTRDLTLQAGPDGGPAGTDGSLPAADGATGATGPGTDGGGSDVAQPGNDGGGDASCSTDLQNDAKNCGRCGHDCLGGTCSSGQCQAWTIVPGQPGAAGFAIDSTSVYWTSLTNEQVLKANKDGTSVTVLASETGTSAGSLPVSLALDDTSVYWVDDNLDSTNPGRVEKCAKAGCDGGGARVTQIELLSPNIVAVDGTSVYWSEYNSNAVGRANKLDGGGFGYLVTQLNSPYGLDVDDASVFFATQDTVGSAPKGAPVVISPSGDAGVTPKTIYTSQNINAIGLSSDDARIYWADNNDPGVIQSAPKGGLGTGVPTTIAQSDHRPIVTAVDATNIYWTAQGVDSSPPTANYFTFVAGYVATCPKTGCPATGPIMLASGLHNPHGIAVDDVAVYFTIEGNIDDTIREPIEGSVMKVAK